MLECEYKDKLLAYLEETLAEEEMKHMEKHFENCPVCQKELDNLLNNKLDIPASIGEVEDEILISKIKGRIKGLRRITIYGIFGFLLGVFSRFYTRDSFIITKAIMALPYKLGEFALGIFFSGYALKPWQEEGRFFVAHGSGYFPFNPILDVLASLVTPAIIGTIIAIMIGYLVSDKRVFQRKKIINFLAGGLAVFLCWTGILYGVYGQTLKRIDNLTGIKGATIYQVEEGGSSWLLHIEQEALAQENYAALIKGIAEAEKTAQAFSPEVTEGFNIVFDFSGGGTIAAYVDGETGTMSMQNGKGYQLAPSTLEQLQRVAEAKDHE